MRHKFGVVLSFIMSAPIVSGCASSDSLESFALRNGPNPTFNEQSVESAGTLRTKIMAELEKQATINGSFNYYDVSVTGFNFVDEQCDAYLNELYTLDHQRERAKAWIGSTGTLTEAILGAVPVSKVSLAVVTQAFGLSSSLLDSLTDSYLFQHHTTDIILAVQKMQAEYRNQITAKASQIQTRPQAYTAIRGYLRLCLPVTIEANITSGLGTLTAETTTKTDGPTVNIRLTGQ